MQKLITSIAKFHGPLLVIVDAFIIASFISDWVAKRRASKEATASATVTTEDEPADDE
jgi:hypothetical protein